MLPRQLKFDKVIPRINHFNYYDHTFYVYCYLNPFKEDIKKYTLDGVETTFGYEPYYIGKATGNGFRHNQHIAEFKKNNKDMNHNVFKYKYMTMLDSNMKEVEKNPGKFDVSMPRNWDEYQEQWVVVLRGYPSQQELQDGEMKMIKEIGTIKNGQGTLTNIALY